MSKQTPARKKATTRRSAKPSRRPQGVRGWARWALKWGLITGVATVLLVAVAGFIAYKKTEIPDPNKAFQTQTTYIYYAGGKTKVGQFAEQNRESISYAEMPDSIKDAVVAAENRSFWTDKGIDPKGIMRAAFSNASSGEITGGASTITQQYVKLLYLNQERTYTRKIKEAFLSLKLQRQTSKQEILEGYLNTIYFGRGAYGIQAASRAFFNVPAKKLTLEQSAVLASVLNNPTRMAPENVDESGVNDALLARYRYVLAGMEATGDITDAEAATASAALPKFPKQKQSSAKGGQKGFMLDMVNDELKALGFKDAEITGGGLRVTTTFDRKAMTAAEQAVKQEAPTTARDGSKITDKKLHAAVASVVPGTGALVGFYAGQDYLKSQINWAIAGGMAGSTMKPFTLATALESGFSLKDTFEGNSPYVFPGGGLEVRNEGEQAGNYSGHDYGAHITALTALEQSVNTAFVDMSEAIPDKSKAIYKVATELGIAPEEAQQDLPGMPSTTTDLYPEDTLLTLGKAQVSPINIANAYASIANGGKRADVHVITKVVDRNGVERYNWKSHTTQAIDEDVAADTAYAMQQVVKAGTGRKALALGRPVGGKTGTATNDDGEVSSAWFVGMTPQLSTAVMYVRGKGREQLDGWMPSYFGADYPARTWLNVMQRDLEGTEVEQFAPPAWVDGEAPDHGHSPSLVKPTKKPKPSKTPKPTKSATVTPSTAPPSVDPSPTAPASSEPPSPTTSTSPCGLLGCPGTTATP